MKKTTKKRLITFAIIAVIAIVMFLFIMSKIKKSDALYESILGIASSLPY